MKRLCNIVFLVLLGHMVLAAPKTKHLNALPVENLKDQVQIGGDTIPGKLRQSTTWNLYLYYTNSGTIRFPLNGGNYGDSEDCTWKIMATTPLEITFTSFNVEDRFDRLYVRDGESHESPVLGNLTGSSIPGPIQTTTNSAYLRFTSDGSVTRTGFELTWEPAGISTTEDPTTVASTKASPSNNTCQCGVANPERIIGGVEVYPNRKYPWQVGLQRPGSTWISCGGSIINDRWILTAAHCILDFSTCQLDGPFSPLNVVVGEHHHKETSDDDANTKTYQVKTFVPHKDLHCSPPTYDFALLELAEPIQFNKVIRPICLPTDDSEDYVGRDGIAIGWGKTSNDGSGSDYLQEVQLPILANDNCGWWGTVASVKLCAGGEEGKAVCNGDSGGVLSVLENNRYIQVGVASYVSRWGCATAGFPNVFARVSKVLPWITTTTANGNNCA